ncbi:MAG: hypothetical protein HFJ55_05830 [Clostridia bacterium]|nr:hypothetical protein [Clostridia bacterium]
MLVESQNIDKMCSFYVSDFHLEMILVPYINQKIDEKENINIITEKDLKGTMEVVMSKMNLENERKEEILNLGWEKNNKQIQDKTNIIVIGTEEYIKEKNKEIQEANKKGLNIVNCYEFEEVKDNIGNIINEHNRSLNTLGFRKF